MIGTKARQTGLTLVETLVAITVFSIMTVGLVPLIGTAMSGSAATRTESVARNVTSKTLERLRGLTYHIAYSSTPRKVDLLDHFFPGRTPSFVPSIGTGYDAATQSYVTTCDSTSTAAACQALPSRAEIPNGFLVEVRATFRTPADPAVTQPVPVEYSWNAAGGADAPPSELLEVKVTTAWSVGTKARTFELRSYLGARARSALPAGSGGGGSPTPPPGGSGPPPPPTTVKLRAEARIDYGYEMTTTYQDASNPPRLTEYTGTLGTAVAYGEQLDSGSKAELSVRAGNLRIIRPPDPAIGGDTGVDVNVNAATFDAIAPPDASTTTSVTAAQQTATNPEVAITAGAGYLAASEAGTLAGTRVGPTVSGGLPFVKGYYDFNGTTAVSPASSWATHMWLMPQASGTTAGSETTTNPLNLYPSTWSRKAITVNDHGTGQVDPRGEVTIDSAPISPGSGRHVTASASIPSHGMILLFPPSYTASNHAVLRINHFDANVNCVARADAAAASTATGSWSALLEYYSYEGSGKNAGYNLRATTLPTQTRTDNPHVPQGNTNPLQAIKNLNGGQGPKVYDASSDAYDVYLFAANGKRGLLTGWTQGSVQTSISADDRVASAQLNGAIRMESSPLYGPWPNASTGQVSQKPQSDLTFSMGKLGCKAEDYR